MKENSRRYIVAVIGASSAVEATLSIAQDVGSAIADRGWHLLTGGGGGVMEAACRGFRQSRPSREQIAIGILPSDNDSCANRFIDVPISTGMGWARNAIIARTANGLIAVGGCSGTLSEIAFAWQANRPIAALTRSGGWSSRLAGSAVDDRRDDVVYAAQTPGDATKYLAARFVAK